MKEKRYTFQFDVLTFEWIPPTIETPNTTSLLELTVAQVIISVSKLLN